MAKATPRNPHKPQTYRLVELHINTIQLADSHQIGADKKAQLLPLQLSFAAITGVALVLHAHPQLVHFAEIEQDKVKRVPHITIMVPAGTKSQA